MRRVKIITELDDGMLGWIHSYARSNFWRVSSYYELVDLIQDGLTVYSKCRQRYAGTAKNKAHFMSLVQRSFKNHVTDLANKRTKLHEEPLASIIPDDADDAFFEDALGTVDETASIMLLIKEAPREIAAVFQLLASEVGLAKLSEPYQRKEDGTRETKDERICRLAGVQPGSVPMLDRVRAYIYQ